MFAACIALFLLREYDTLTVGRIGQAKRQD